MAQQLFIEVQLLFHVLVYPAPDVPGDWIAHCLELDLVAQGASDEHARATLKDAFETVVGFNLDNGLMPIQIRFAPSEVWEAAGVPMPESIEIKTTSRFTSERTSRPIDLADLPLSFETIVAKRAPAAHV